MSPHPAWPAAEEHKHEHVFIQSATNTVIFAYPDAYSTRARPQERPNEEATYSRLLEALGALLVVDPEPATRQGFVSTHGDYTAGSAWVSAASKRTRQLPALVWADLERIRAWPMVTLHDNYIRRLFLTAEEGRRHWFVEEPLKLARRPEQPSGEKSKHLNERAKREAYIDEAIALAHAATFPMLAWLWVNRGASPCDLFAAFGATQEFAEAFARNILIRNLKIENGLIQLTETGHAVLREFEIIDDQEHQDGAPKEASA
jgi:hypothetical protein